MSLRDIKAVIFDLDGVIVSTDDCHCEAWQRLADRNGIYFDKEINKRQRGVSRMESLEVLLERAGREYSPQEKAAMAEEKNAEYVGLIQQLTPEAILPGAKETLEKLRAKGIALAIGSSSKNAPVILSRVGLSHAFDAVADGNGISRSKPDPEVFLLAASMLQIDPAHCLVVEDADAGVEAALRGGMRVLAVGAAMEHPGATIAAASLADIDLAALIGQPADR